MSDRFPTAAQTFIRMQQSDETRKAYEKDLDRWFAWAEVNLDHDASKPLPADEALAFRAFLQESGLAVNTQARVWSTVKVYFRFLVVGGSETTSPFEFIKGPKRTTNVAPKTPSDADVEALVGAASSEPQRALIIALLLNGLRASEVATLPKSGIESHEGHVFLRVLGKGQKERLVPATIEAQRAMVRYAEMCSVPQRLSALVVSEYGGGGLTLRQVEHAVYKSAEYAGIEGMHPHALRHHYATRLIRAGASPLHVKDLLGHASVATTQVYVRLDLADLVEAANRDPRNKQAPLAVAADEAA